MVNNNPNDPTYLCPSFMPSGSPVPVVLTSEELIQLLRLDDRNPKLAEATLKYYRDGGHLRGIRLGKTMRYTLNEVLKFLERQTELTNKRHG